MIDNYPKGVKPVNHKDGDTPIRLITHMGDVHTPLSFLLSV
jgi:hypothetical protein